MSPTVKRQGIAHAMLLMLAAVGAMDPKALRKHGELFGNGTAVSVAYMRLQQRGLVDCTVRLTDKGRRALRRLTK